MSATGPAVPTHPVLGGIVLNVAIESWEVRPRQVKTVHELATGNRRETYAYAGAGLPTIKTQRTFELAWGHLRGEVGARVGRLLSAPGPHALVLWQVENVSYAGDGSRRDFLCPWLLAVDVVTPPEGLDPARFYPEVRTDLAGGAFTYLPVASADYAAGEPGPGEVWWRQGGLDFKLATAPAAGSTLYLDVVPVFSVFESAETTRTYSNPVRRPRTLSLLER